MPEKLLQLHIIAPEVIDIEFETPPESKGGELHAIARSFELHPVTGGDISDESHSELASGFFERRADNMQAVDGVHEEVEAQFPDATVFRYEVSPVPDNVHHHPTPSVDTPGIHVIIHIANVERTQPDWRTKLDSFDVSPTLRGGRLYHADVDRVYAIDAASGTLDWSTDREVNMVPEAAESTVLCASNWSVFALDAETGDLKWEDEFEKTQANGLQSRIVHDDERAYVGREGGDIIEYTIADGSRRTVTSYDRTARPTALDDDTLAVLAEGKVRAVERDGTERWSADKSGLSLDALPTLANGTLYVSDSSGVRAFDFTSGEKRWTSDEYTVETRWGTRNRNGRDILSDDRLERQLDWMQDDGPTSDQADSEGESRREQSSGGAVSGTSAERNAGVDEEPDDSPDRQEKQTTVKATETLAVESGAVVVPTTRGIVGLDTSDGSVRWTYLPDGMTQHTPPVPTGEGSILVGESRPGSDGWEANSLCRVDVTTGDVERVYELGGVISTPQLDGNRLVCPSGDELVSLSLSNVL